MDIEQELRLVYEELAAPEPYRRYEAVIMLGNSQQLLGIPPTREMADRILPLLNDSDSHVRYYVAVALGKLGYPEAISALRRQLDDEGFVIEGPSPKRAIEEAIRVLGGVSGPGGGLWDG